MIKTGIKIRVTPEQSKKVQKICFDNGIYWWSWRKAIVKDFIHLDKPYLFIDKKEITCCNKDEEDFFKRENNTEVSAEYFIKTNGTCIYNEVIKNKFMKLIDKRNKANKNLREFAKKYNLEELI